MTSLSTSHPFQPHETRVHLLCDKPPNSAAINAVKPILKDVNVVASNMCV